MDPNKKSSILEPATWPYPKSSKRLVPLTINYLQAQEKQKFSSDLIQQLLPRCFFPPPPTNDRNTIAISLFDECIPQCSAYDFWGSLMTLSFFKRKYMGKLRLKSHRTISPFYCRKNHGVAQVKVERFTNLVRCTKDQKCLLNRVFK